MPEPLPSRRVLRRRRRRKRLVGRWWFWVGLVVLVLFGAVAWVGVRGWLAKGELEAAQAAVPTMKSQIAAFDLDAARHTFGDVERRTESAEALTSDPIWRIAELTPVLGKNLTVVRELAAVTQSVMADVARPLVGLADVIGPQSLTPKDGAIDLAPIQETIPVLATASAAATEAAAAARSVDAAGTIEVVSAAKERLVGLIDELTPMLSTAARVVPLVPGALGADGLRTYVVMFQNNAEPRALGGTALSFAVITIDRGRISLASTVAAGSEAFPSFFPPVVSLPEGLQNVFTDEELASYIPNVTGRPSFTAAAEATRATWLRVFGYDIDGIVSVDPVALSQLLRATQPITLSTGDVLSSDTLVPLLLNQVYQRYNTGDNAVDNAAQDALYTEAVAATFSAFMSGPLDAGALIDAVLQGTSQARLLLWSTHPEEQQELVALGQPGELPVSDETTDRVGVYFHDNVGSKLGFFLRQSLALQQGICAADGRANYRVTVTVTNSLEPIYTETISSSIAGQWEREGVPRGWERLIVLLYSPPGSTVSSVMIDGEPTPLDSRHDSGNPVDRQVVLVPAGATVTLTYDVIAATPGERQLEALTTPMTTATAITEAPLDCATVLAR